ncbi:uncharacterized protein BCN122_III0422 [Burkholderia cenocepacia]|nr:uncharacterized protein BCN122_III0422 [Burkholderia cenocepacia]
MLSSGAVAVPFTSAIMNTLCGPPDSVVADKDAEKRLKMAVMASLRMLAVLYCLAWET